MESPIDRLEEELFDACVTQVLAEDEATYERWEADEKAHLAERFIINPMPPSLQPLVDEALSQWETMENAFLSRIHKDREGFLLDFDTARSAFLRNTEEWQLFALTVGNSARGMVRNMDCASLFAWILPAADPANRAKRAATCKMVTAVFYAELLAKHLEDRILDDREFLAKMEERWRLVNNP